MVYYKEIIGRLSFNVLFVKYSKVQGCRELKGPIENNYKR
jgi:hypothetical protein